MIKFEHESIFDPEDVVPGDLLRDKKTLKTLFVADVDDDSCEYLCVNSIKLMYSSNANISASVDLVPFEESDDYIRIRPIYE